MIKSLVFAAAFLALSPARPHSHHCRNPEAAECLPDAPPGAKCCVKCHAVCERKSS